MAAAPTAALKVIISTLDESSSVQDRLRAALRENSVKVMDLFAEWDVNGDHHVDKKEFRRAMENLGFTHSRPHIDAVFESLDEDGSGTIDFKELNRALKGKMVAKPVPPPPAAGGGAAGSSVDVGDYDGGGVGGGGGGGSDAAAGGRVRAAPERPEEVLQRKLREALSLNAVRVIDLFREWDEDKDGIVTQSEFTRALPLLGLQVDKKAADQLFRGFDTENKGELTLQNLQAALRSGKSVTLQANMQAGGAGKIEQEKTGKIKLRKAKKREGPVIDSALVKALAETEPEEVGSEDEEYDEEAGFSGSKVVARLRDALAMLGTRVIDVFKQWDENSDGVVSYAPTRVHAHAHVHVHARVYANITTRRPSRRARAGVYM